MLWVLAREGQDDGITLGEHSGCKHHIPYLRASERPVSYNAHL
jgi:hypothetical protein